MTAILEISQYGGNARKHILYLRLSDCGLTQAVFLRYFWNFIIMGFGLPPEFSCWNLWHENGHVFAKDKFVIFDCSPASIAGGLAALFSLVRKKLPKKYAEGLRALLTPGDAVKFLRFDGDTGNFAVSSNARKRSLSLPFSDCGLTHRCFLEVFGFLLYGVLVL